MLIKYTIVFVGNMARSVVFYRDVMKIPLKFESPEWTEFVTEGAILALHLADAPSFPEKSGSPIAPGQCSPGFSVKNLDRFHHRMVDKNVKCIQEPKSVFGTRIAQYLDPDGLSISVGEETTAKKRR